VIHSTLHCSLFFYTDTATTEIYTLSLHDALPIYSQKTPLIESLLKDTNYTSVIIFCGMKEKVKEVFKVLKGLKISVMAFHSDIRSEEHTSELQSRSDLVCRLLLEKKKRHDHRSTALQSWRDTQDDPRNPAGGSGPRAQPARPRGLHALLQRQSPQPAVRPASHSCR